MISKATWPVDQALDSRIVAEGEAGGCWLIELLPLGSPAAALSTNSVKSGAKRASF